MFVYIFISSRFLYIIYASQTIAAQTKKIGLKTNQIAVARPQNQATTAGIASQIIHSTVTSQAKAPAQTKIHQASFSFSDARCVILSIIGFTIFNNSIAIGSKVVHIDIHIAWIELLNICFCASYVCVCFANASAISFDHSVIEFNVSRNASHCSPVKAIADPNAWTDHQAEASC